MKKKNWLLCMPKNILNWVVFANLTLMISVNSAFASQLSAHAILLKADRVRSPVKSYSFDANVTDYMNSGTTRNEYKVSVKNQKISLVEQIAPERLRGRKLLMLDHDLWFWTPNVHRPIRVSFQQRLTGEVSNGDLARTAFALDYTPTLKGIVIYKKRTTYKLHLKAAAKGVTYSQIDYYVDKQTYFPRKADFFALSGKLLKTAYYSHFKKILGWPRVTEIDIHDAIQKSNHSVLIFTNFKREHFNEILFRKESLGN